MKIVDYLMIGATIRIGREILCLPYAGFFLWTCPYGLNIISSSGHESAAVIEATAKSICHPSW